MKAKTAEPTYKGDFQPHPMPERIVCVSIPEHPTFRAGIKTITHNRAGARVRPHKVVAIEMDGCQSFDINPVFARRLAVKLLEFAQSIEDEPRKS